MKKPGLKWIPVKVLEIAALHSLHRHTSERPTLAINLARRQLGELEMP